MGDELCAPNDIDGTVRLLSESEVEAIEVRESRKPKRSKRGRRIPRG